DMVSFALDGRLGRHVDLNAGVSWRQKFRGFLNGYVLSTNNGTLTSLAGCSTTTSGATRVTCPTSSDRDEGGDVPRLPPRARRMRALSRASLPADKRRSCHRQTRAVQSPRRRAKARLKGRS